MPFTISELRTLFLYIVIVFLVTQIYYKDWVRSTRTTVATAVLIIVGEMIEAFVGETASIIYFVSLLIIAVFLHFKKPK